jgi:hypothetical protein
MVKAPNSTTAKRLMLLANKSSVNRSSRLSLKSIEGAEGAAGMAAWSIQSSPLDSSLSFASISYFWTRLGSLLAEISRCSLFAGSVIAK